MTVRASRMTHTYCFLIVSPTVQNYKQIAPITCLGNNITQLFINDALHWHVTVY